MIEEDKEKKNLLLNLHFKKFKLIEGSNEKKKDQGNGE